MTRFEKGTLGAMRILIFCLVALVSAAGVPAAASSGAAESWLPLSRSELVRILTQASKGSPLTVDTVEEYVSHLRARLDAEAQRSGQSERAERAEIERLEAAAGLLAPDSVWFMHGPELPIWVIMAGSGERVHSLKITVPVVNHSESESDRVFAALAELFSAVYPDWPEAREWPVQSLQAAWDNHPLARNTPLADPEDVFIRKSFHGVASTTYGVPPDIVVYDVTVRDNCVPSLAKGNPFQRLIC